MARKTEDPPDSEDATKAQGQHGNQANVASPESAACDPSEGIPGKRGRSLRELLLLLSSAAAPCLREVALKAREGVL